MNVVEATSSRSELATAASIAWEEAWCSGLATLSLARASGAVGLLGPLATAMASRSTARVIVRASTGW